MFLAFEPKDVHKLESSKTLTKFTFTRYKHSKHTLIYFRQNISMIFKTSFGTWQAVR